MYGRLIEEYGVDQFELTFEDVLPKFTSSYTPDYKLFSLDGDVIDSYLDSRNSVFSKEELLESLKMLKDEN